MQAILSPAGLRWAAVLLLFTVPLAALQVILATHLPWWRLPVWDVGGRAGLAALVFVPASVALFLGRKWAWYPAAAAGGLWALFTFWGALHYRDPSWGFLALFLTVFFGMTLGWTRYQFGRSFLDPGLRWFQGLPVAIPGLSCQVQIGGQDGNFQVCRLDREGIFVFTPQNLPIPGDGWKPGLGANLVLRFRDREVRCEGLVTRWLNRGAGPCAGIRFQDLTPDAKKELGDFVEILRGEGYVG